MVLASTKPTKEERRDYAKVLEKFNSFLEVRKNVIFESARFNRRNQLPDETAEQYIMALYNLTANCKYGAMEEDLIRDRLVVGIRDSALYERLQLNPDLDLEKAKKCIRQRESVHEQQTVLNGMGAGPTLEAIRAGADRKKQQHDQRQHGSRGRNAFGRVKQTNKQCTRCGKEPHSRDKCPAKDAICNRCQKKGHYRAQCLTKRASVDSAAGLDTAFLDSTYTMGPEMDETAWYTDIGLGDQVVKFKMDTGTEVTAISSKTYQAL